MDPTTRLNKLLQKYVEQDTEELRRAKRLVADRAKTQTEIKDLMMNLSITEHSINTDTLEAKISYKLNTYDRVDCDLLPADIKETYKKVQEIWMEHLDYSRK